MIGRTVWKAIRPLAALAIFVGLGFAFRASEDIGVAAAVVALGLGLVALRIDRQLLDRRGSGPS